MFKIPQPTKADKLGIVTRTPQRWEAPESSVDLAELDIADRSLGVRLELPNEFLDLCIRDRTTAATVLRGFIADLCGITNCASNPRPDGYSSNGSDERMLAQAYYDRCGYR